MNHLHYILSALLVVSFIFFGHASAQSISGYVMDENNEPLPYATVYLEGTTQGTVTNMEGFYRLNVNPGKYTLIIRYIGYQAVKKQVDVNENVSLDVKMSPEDVVLEDVVITSDGRDPAYGIIQMAIDRKQENEIPWKNYSYDAYTKTVFRYDVTNDSTEGPGLIGVMGGMSKEEKDTLGDEEKKDIAYLTETVSKVYISEPNKVKEEIISSRVSGDADGYSFFGNIFLKMTGFTPYTNLVPMKGISERGLVSPIANNAFMFYDYKLLGTVKQNNVKSYKIKVIPKRAHDPVFDGIIYIADGSYAVTSLDFVVSKENQINFFDTVRVQQDFLLTEDSVFVPFNLNFRFIMHMKLMGFKIRVDGNSGSVLSEYDAGMDYEKKFFSNDIIAIGDSANKRDSSYWEAVRPVPLEEDEMRDYHVKDSLEQVHNSPEYLDSLSRASREFKLNRYLLFGYHPRNYRKKVRWDFGSPLDISGFNTMEGYYLGMEVKRSQEFGMRRDLDVGGKVRYGFSNEKFSWTAFVSSNLSKKKTMRFTLEGGDYVSEFSPMEQISPSVNSWYSLLFRLNWLRLYQKQFVELKWRQELFNGFYLNLEGDYEQRNNLPNTADNSYFSKEKEYKPNFFIPFHQAVSFTAGFTYRPGNKYISTPDGRVNLGSKWPLFTASYTKGMPDLLDSDVDYERMEGGIRDSWRLGLLGELSWNVSGGTFLNTDSMFLPDAAHFKGNRTIFRPEKLKQFSLMDYYSYATNESWIEAHAEQAFGGFILNKLPLIRKLRMTEFAGVHWLYTEQHGEYMELNFGVQKRFFKDLLPVRADFHWRVLGESPFRFGGSLTFDLGGLSGSVN